MMKTIVMLLLALVLVACANETTEAVTPPVIETPAPTEPVEEPVVESDPEPEPEPEPDPVVEEETDVITETENDTTTETDGPRVFTVAELANYNGQNGQPAYVAVDGIVYDVTFHPSWQGGNHRGVQAGQDVSNIIPSSHRQDMRFEANPIVGTLE
jgi:predicted heme/steroid binding protein